ncbi:MAG: type II toxin-antitoxin system VapC family toxin [Deltaproteobacteria bacterium]|nr:type II toxin-antitoxin system VapC family toxin [Deltaproteobacteria bacterium]
MKPVLVDANVIIDIATEDTNWYQWSAEQLEQCASDSILIINPIIYAEVSIGFARIEELDAVVPLEFFKREPIPFEAGFLAGKAFINYRRKGGVRNKPLPDFFIGAHAAIRGYRLLTRDVSRYRTYFPSVELIAPS